jgi:hypothetical protein
MEFHIRWLQVHRGKDEIHLISAQPTQTLPAGAGSHVCPDPRMLLPELCQVSGEYKGGGGLTGSESQLTADAFMLLGKGVGQAIYVLHQGRRQRVELPAGQSQGDAGTATFKERNVQVLFQRAHLKGYGGLTGKDPLSGSGYAAESSGMTKGPKLLETISPIISKPLAERRTLVDSHLEECRLRRLVTDKPLIYQPK